MPNSELDKYVSTARKQNIPDIVLKEHLVKAGWDQKQVDEALVISTPPTTSPELPPPPVPHFGMWVAFQYIILFVCLYISFTGLGGILHHLVDQVFPDSLDQTGYNYFSSRDDFLLKGYIASILVAFPIFAVLFLILKKQALEKVAVKNLRARKMLIYITLIGTFLIMIGHLITTIYGFLGGITTMRSLAHLIVTFLVAGTVFVYLLLEVKEDRKAQW